MIILGDKHLQSMEHSLRERFLALAVAHVQAELPAVVGELDERRLWAKLRELLTAAEKLGFVTEDSALRYMEVALCCGPKFGQGRRDGTIVQMLRSPQIVAQWPLRRPFVLAAWNTL